jgi:hypothetical protein
MNCERPLCILFLTTLAIHQLLGDLRVTVENLEEPRS